MENQQSGGIARLGRMLGDKIGRELVIEIRSAHGLLAEEAHNDVQQDGKQNAEQD